MNFLDAIDEWAVDAIKAIIACALLTLMIALFMWTIAEPPHRPPVVSKLLDMGIDQSGPRPDYGMAVSKPVVSRKYRGKRP